MQKHTIGLRLVAALLVLAAIVPLALLAGALALSSWREQIAVADRQAVEMARAVSVSIDKEIESVIAALNVLGQLGMPGSFDAAQFQEVALRLQSTQPGWLGLMLLDPKGRVLENTADPSAAGSAETAAWARVVAETRRAAVSDLNEDPATRRYFVVVAVPLVRRDSSPYVLAVRVAASRLSEILRLQDPPSDAVLSLIDSGHRIIARARDEKQSIGKVAGGGFIAAVGRAPEGSWRERLADGQEAYGSHSRSTLTGWTVDITRPVAKVDEPIRDSIRALAAAGAAVLGAALAAALLFGHMIVRGVDAARGAATALARGQRITPHRSRLTELDDLWRGLLEAEEILEQRLTERDAADRERRRALAAERLARRASEKDQARLTVTLRSIGDAVIATETGGRVTMLNEVAQALTGWREADALEQTIEDVFRIVDERTRADLENPVAIVCREGHAVGLSLADRALLVARDGRETPVASSAAPIRATDGALLGVVLVFRDVTEARAAEEMRAALLEREQAARREAEALSHSKDEFVAIVSHELRTPLSAIFGWTRLLRRGSLDPAARERALEVIERNTRAQTQLIDDLLDMSRIIRGNLRLEMRVLDLAVVLQAAADAVRPVAEAKQITIALHGLQPIPIRGDADRLQQVLCNVLGNAVKFTPQGGRVEARLACEGSDAVVRVQDSGVGIDDMTLAHVFEPFRQGGTARALGGLGVGLALVRHLVGLHGGTVGAASGGENCGATFTIRLPAPAQASDAAGEPAALDTQADAQDALAGKHVLVVDDDEDVRGLVTTALAEADARLDSAGSVAEAQRILETCVPDVVLTDIGMAGASGYDLLAHIRADPRLAPVLVVAVTAYSRSEDRADAYRLGFDLHIGKPLEPQTLVQAVGRLVRSRQRARAATLPPSDTEVGREEDRTGVGA